MLKETARAKFITTATKPSEYPVIRNESGKILPEVAVVGRSNVGKSSLLNHLFYTKHLVKTSSTPGKTQALNFFSYSNEIAFCDLPGYGYAQVPRAIKKLWGPMIQTYIEKRENLKLILLLLDIRRIPNDEDRQLIDWVVHHEKAMIIVLTKTDKLNQSEKKLNSDKILEALGVGNVHLVQYSVPKNRGRKELMIMIRDAIRDETKEEESGAGSREI